MRFGNSKQKLVLNRIRKPLEFQRLPMQAQPMIKQQNHQLPLVKKDLNLVNGNNNSSIFRKQSQPSIQPIFKLNTSAIRCRSLSSGQFHRRIVSKAAPIIEQKPLKLQQTNSEPHEDESTWGQDISEILSQISSDFKSRGVLTLKNNRFWINCDDFKQLTKCIGEKILSQKQKIEKQSKLRQLSASQASTIAQSEKKNTLAVQNCVLLYNQIIKKHKNLSINSKVYQHSLIVEPSSEHQQLSWKVIQDIQTHRITPELLLRIAEKIKSFRIQSCIQQLKVKELSKKKEQLLQAIDEQTASLDSCNRLIKQKQQFLEKIDKSAKEMQSYLKSQPNKILQQEAEGYKKSEQQLFDLAFMLEQSSPESLEAFVEENIMIPNQGFKFQLKSFPSQQLCEGQKYVITQEEMQKFKCTMANIFASLISKFKSLLERKHLKVKKFVGIMRQLASYTIGKRQYLAEINKKMVVVSVKTEGNLEQLKICAQRSNACSESIAAIAHLREMFELIKKTYYQAQLFY